MDFDKFSMESTVINDVSVQQESSSCSDFTDESGTGATNGKKDDVVERWMGHFIERKDEVYVTVNRHGEYGEMKLSNFTLDVKCLAELVDTYATKLYVIYSIHCPSSADKLGKILQKDFIEHLSREIFRNWPELRIYSSVPNADRLFREYLSEKYAFSDGARRRTIRYYTEAGWTHDGRYLSGSDEDCINIRRIPDVSSVSAEDILQVARDARSLSSDPRVSAAILLSIHLDALVHLFSVAGFPVQHVMAYVGPTNSRKTETAKVTNARTFNVDTMVNFVATETGIDLTMCSLCRDMTMVLDNLSNAKNRDMQQKLLNFILQFGDSTAKIKTTNGGTELVQGEMRGCAILTAESTIDNIQLSTRLRIFFVPFSETSIDNNALSKLQADRAKSQKESCPTKLDLYKAAFIRFLERHYKDLIQFISDFQPPRFQLRYPRHARMYRILATTAAIIVGFWEECGALAKEEGEKIIEQFLVPAIQDLLRYNESLCNEDDPTKLFLRAISSGIGQRLIEVAENKRCFAEKGKDFIGYWDGQCLKLDPKRIYRYASHIYGTQRFTATEADIWDTLRDQKISEGYFDKKKRIASRFKSVQVNGVTTEMLCLRWDKVEEILNESRLDEEDIEE